MKYRNIFDVSGKVALVTGAGSGLGRVFCEALAEFGADVVSCDIDEGRAQETCNIVRDFPHRVLAIKVDVADHDQVKKMVDKAVAEMGSIDVLVNCAGVSGTPANIHSMPVEDWDKVISINLRGVFLCLRETIPIMIKQNRGCIINISSVRGVRAHPKVFPHAHYGASKAGIISLTQHAAIEYAEKGIRVNCIAPGFHRGTNLGKEWHDNWPKAELAAYDDTILKTTPLGRKGEANELAGLVVYLASDASSYVTGQVFIHDGGLTI
jgi:NAD(P)-dependent dehydrogenase (short-subunit alcohol dehydrogenase family)